MNTIHWRRARPAAACCSALTPLTLGAADVTAAKARTATAAAGSGGTPVVPTNDGPVRGTTAGTVNEFLSIPCGTLVQLHPRASPSSSDRHAI